MDQKFRFTRTLLSGHPGDVSTAVKHVIVRGVNHGLVVTSTTDGGHASGSYHYRLAWRNPLKGWAVDFGHPRPGTPEARDAETEFQRDLINTLGPGAFRELFGPDNNWNVKNGQRITLGEGTDLETLHDTHVHVAPARPIPLPERSREQVKALQAKRAAKRERRRRRRNMKKARDTGAAFVSVIFNEARKLNLSVPLALALIEQESGFKNVFGHDPTIYAGAGTVTEEKYKAYKRQRGPHGSGGMQGVGPAQLTYWSFQDRADELGGCWRPEVNISVGLSTLANLVRAHGTRKGLAIYNGGAANPNYAYADQVQARQAKWAARLK